MDLNLTPDDRVIAAMMDATELDAAPLLTTIRRDEHDAASRNLF